MIGKRLTLVITGAAIVPAIVLLAARVGSAGGHDASTHDDRPPASQLHAVDPATLVSLDSALDRARGALSAWGTSIADAKLLMARLEPYGSAKAALHAGDNASVGDDRQVYRIEFTGAFASRRAPPGTRRRTGSHLVLIIDAATNEVLDVSLLQA